mgnify:CR=1 FL=1
MIRRPPRSTLDRSSAASDVYKRQNQCGISLDSSGEILNHRGYRAHSDTAPINECLAAAMIILSGWDGDCDFIDPMCGSGTIAIEAAYIARNIAPGLLRDDFGFMSWADFDEPLYEEVYDKTLEEIKDFNHSIYAFDISQKSIDLSTKNAAIGKVNGDIIFGVQDFLEPINSPIKNALIMFNPPYGDRMKKDDIDFFYKSIGDSLKKNWIGNTAWIITSNFSALKLLGLSTSKKIKLYNGCLLYTSDDAEKQSSVDLGGPRIIKKKTNIKKKRLQVV